jgi:hypothetical protein
MRWSPATTGKCRMELVFMQAMASLMVVLAEMVIGFLIMRSSIFMVSLGLMGGCGSSVVVAWAHQTANPGFGRGCFFYPIYFRRGVGW